MGAVYLSKWRLPTPHVVNLLSWFRSVSLSILLLFSSSISIQNIFFLFFLNLLSTPTPSDFSSRLCVFCFFPLLAFVKSVSFLILQHTRAKHYNELTNITASLSSFHHSFFFFLILYMLPKGICEAGSPTTAVTNGTAA